MEETRDISLFQNKVLYLGVVLLLKFSKKRKKYHNFDRSEHLKGMRFLRRQFRSFGQRAKNPFVFKTLFNNSFQNSQLKSRPTTRMWKIQRFISDSNHHRWFLLFAKGFEKLRSPEKNGAFLCSRSPNFRGTEKIPEWYSLYQWIFIQGEVL